MDIINYKRKIEQESCPLTTNKKKKTDKQVDSIFRKYKLSKEQKQHVELLNSFDIGALISYI